LRNIDAVENVRGASSRAKQLISQFAAKVNFAMTTPVILKKFAVLIAGYK